MTLSENKKLPESIHIIPISGLPLIEPGDDLPGLLIKALNSSGLRLIDKDVLVVTHKIISKAEGRMIRSSAIVPGAAARKLAEEIEMDPYKVQLILDESVRVVRKRKGLIITQHQNGWICANAGVDFSNAPDDYYVCLPLNADHSAQKIKQGLEQYFGVKIGVIISDSHGRPFRLGVSGVALGVSGLPGLVDRTGETDLYGYKMQNTQVALADLIDNAALLVIGESNEGVPAALIRGLLFEGSDGSGKELIRPDEKDLFR
jgi:coenzyme F420-0:L-glutamate ligase/coenzyme F420-1:gamma-L-glutamate ligase